MRTKELAEITGTRYFIEYVFPEDMVHGKLEFYFQLVRTKDLEIIFKDTDINNVYLYCWKNGITAKDVNIYY